MKRAIIGVGAVLSAGVLSVSSAFATDPLDYANSVGQIDDADTYNWVIEATSDGGYIAGGQTVGCFKEEMGDVRLDKYGSNYYGEATDMQECLDYFEAHPDSVWWNTDGSLIEEFCGNSGGSVEELNSAGTTKVVADEEGGRGASDDYYYFYSCVDYAAKFKQDGTKEWLTPVENGVMPVAVGETNNDYRLITADGTVHTMSKTDGSEGITGQLDLDGDYLIDAIVNQDGTTTTYGSYDGLSVFGANGNYIRGIDKYAEDENTTTYIGNDLIGSGLSKGLVKSENGFLTARITTEYTVDEQTGDEQASYTVEIVEISPDLKTITPIVTIPATSDEAMEFVAPLSTDDNGNIMALAYTFDDTSDELTMQIVSYDNSGNQIAAKSVDEIFDMDAIENGGVDEPTFLDGFTVMDTTTNSLRRLSPQLEDVYSYQLADGETINDVVLLTDGSLAGVGGSTESTSNYNVSGSMNGTYLRMAKVTATNGTTNPQTGDEIKLYAAVAAFVVLSAGAFAFKGLKRR